MWSLTLRNWMSHEDVTLTCRTPVAFVLGQNGVGKTAIRDALEFVLLGTGELRGIATKKELGALAITEGAISCEVILETDRVRARRVMNRKGEQTVTRAQRESAEAQFEAETPVALKDALPEIEHVHADVLRSVLDPFGFFRLDPQRRRELLIQATTAKVTAEVVADALFKAAPDSIPSHRQRVAAIAAAQGFRQAEAVAVEARREAKRAVEGAGDDPKVEATFEGQDLSQGTLAEYQAHQADVRAEHSMAEEGARQRAHTEGLLEAAEARQKALLATDLGPEPDAGAIADTLTRAKEAEAEARAAVDASLAGLGVRPAAANGKFTKPKLCPATTGLAHLECPVKAEVFAKALKEGAAVREAAEKEHASKRAAHEGLLARHTAARKALADAEAALKAAEDRAAKQAAVERELDELEGRVNTLAEAVKEAIPDAEAIAARLERGTRIVEAKKRYDSQQAAIAHRAAFVASAKADVASWDVLATALKPTGVETQLGGNAAESFRAFLAPFEPLAGEVTLDAEFQLRARGRHYLQLSQSQRMALGIALQGALARAVEFPLLVCDAIDTFDGPARAAWADVARGLDFSAGVVGIATIVTEPPQPPPDWATSYWLHDGKVDQIGGVNF